MVVILISWIILSSTFLAWGNIIVFLWNKLLNRNDRFNIFDIFWMGLCIVATLSMAISLFLPLNIYILIIFLCFTCIYWIFNHKAIALICRNILTEIKAFPFWFNILLILIVIIIGMWAISYPYHYDNGLYHLQSIMWTDKYAVVPGLGNLHGRLAFNTSTLVLTTLFSYHPDYFPVFYPINSLCVLVFFLWLFSKLKGNISFAKLVVFIGIFILAIVPYANFISGTSTDLLPNLLVCYILFSCVLNDTYTIKRILPIVFISIFCITTKLSAGLITIVSIYIIVVQLKKKDYKSIAFIATLGLVVLLPWFLRNIILSGYLFFPFPSLDIFSFDWKMPSELVQNEKDSVYYWARVKQTAAIVKQMSLSQWGPMWLKHRMENRDGNQKELLFFFLSLISPLILLLRSRRVRLRPNLLFIWGISLVGALYCFFTAPDLRFCWGFFIVSGFIPLLLFDFKKLDKKIYFVTILMLFLIYSGIYCHYTFRHIKNAQAIIGRPSYTLLIAPQPYDYVEKTIKPGYIATKVDNIMIYSPTYRDRCFDACFPCIPRNRLEENLEMRGETLQEGFRIRKEPD